MIERFLTEKNFIALNSTKAKLIDNVTGVWQKLAYCEETTRAKYECEQEGKKFVLTNQNKTTFRNTVSKRKST